MKSCSISILFSSLLFILAGCENQTETTYATGITQYYYEDGSEMPGIRSYTRPDSTLLVISSDKAFECGGCQFNKDAHNYLQTALTAIKSIPHKSVVVRAYTDDVSSDRDQLALTNAQAQAVAAYFWASGVSLDNIDAQGTTPSQTLGSQTDNPRELSMVRRVEISLLP